MSESIFRRLGILVGALIGIALASIVFASAAGASGVVSMRVDSSSRDSSTGNLLYDVTVSASESGPDCLYYCYMALVATTTTGSEVVLDSYVMGSAPSGSVSLVHRFAGTHRIPKIVSFSAQIGASGPGGGLLNSISSSVTDAYPTASVTLSNVSIGRSASTGDLQYDASVSARNYALPDGLCGDGTFCDVVLEATRSDGSKVVIASHSVDTGTYATYPATYRFQGTVRTAAIVSLQVVLAASYYGSVSLYSNVVPVTDPYPMPSVSVSVGSIGREAMSGKLSYRVTATASNYGLADGVCADTYGCVLSLYATTVTNATLNLGSVDIASGSYAVYPLSHTFEGLVVSTQIVSVSAQVSYAYGGLAPLSSAAVSVTDPYPVPSVSMSTPSITRDTTNGKISYVVAVSASNYALPDAVCNSPWGGCMVEVHGTDINGQIVNLDSTSIPSGADVSYPYQHEFRGEVAGSALVSVTANVFYAYYPLPPVSSGPIAVTDTYPTPVVTAAVSSISRNPSTGLLDYKVDVSASYYALSDVVCGSANGGCAAEVLVSYADGTTGSSEVEYPPTGNAVSYPWRQTFRGTVADKPVSSIRASFHTIFYNVPPLDSVAVPFSVGPIHPGESQGGSNPSEKACQCSHADPVNTATGEFFLPATDLSISGVGPGVQVARTYSSTAASADGPFGFGWSANFESHLSVVMPGTTTGAPPLEVRVTQENGSTVLFGKTPSGTYVADARVMATLTFNTTTSTWTFLRHGQQTLTFNSDGKLTTLADLNGNTVTYSYSFGRLTSISASGGRSISLSWGGSHISGLSDSAGRSVSYRYDTTGNLTGVTAADSAVSGYGYDAAHYMTSLSKPGGGGTSNSYDSQHRLVFQTDPLGRGTTFSYNGSSTTITAPDGSETVETYGAGQLISQTRAAGTSQAATTKYSYDPSSNLASSTDPLGQVTSYTYDAAGNQLTSTDPLGRTTITTYSSLNEVLTTTDPLGRITTFTYDTAGNLTSATSPGGRTQRWTHNSNGTTATITDARGKVTTHAYDGAGRPTSTTDPDGRTTTLSYNSAGYPTSTTDNAGNQTVSTVDAVGRVLTVSDPVHHVTTYTYDADGNRTTTTDANNHTTTSVYDSADQVTSTLDARGKTTTLTYTATGLMATITDPDGRTNGRTYDSLGRLATATDSGGYVTSYGYDANGHRTSVTTPSGAQSRATYDAAGQRLTSTDGNGHTTTYSYDAAGQVTTVTDPLSRVTSTTYTADGQAATVTLANASTQAYQYNETGKVASFTDADGNLTTYTYDAAGLLSSKTAPGNITTTYSYDIVGRLATTTLPDTTTVTTTYDATGRVTLQQFSTSGATNISFGYDAVGARTSMTDTSGTSSYSYNANGQLTSETNGANQTLAYSYTDSGLLASITYPGSKTVTYTYNSSGRMGALTDWNSNTTSFGWTANGQLATQTDPNGVTQTRSYDPAGQTTGLTTTGTTSTLSQYTYGYDNAGQLVSDSTTDPILAAVAHTYTYDALNQVLSSNDGTTTVGYNPTAAGQLVSKGHTTLTYNSAQQLTDLTPTAGSATSFRYDGNGSRISATVAAADPIPAHSTGYGYDAAVNLATVTMSGDTSPTLSYVSNGNGLRQSRTQASTTTNFLWSTAGKLPLLLGDGSSTYIYGTSSTPIAQIDNSGTTTYLFGDLLGSVRLITDTNGAAVGTTEYDTYGPRTNHTGTTDSLIGYTGNWTDPTTSLVYLRARDYDPATGQFLVTDPKVDQTRQPYAYVTNSPLNHADPLGLATIGGCGGGEAGAWLGGSVQLCPLVTAMDDRNGDIQMGGTFTWGFGIFAPTNANASVTEQVTNARTVEQLGGGFTNAGVGVDLGVGAVGSGFWGDVCGAPGDKVIGGEAGISTGVGISVHAQETYTVTWSYAKFNPIGAIKFLAGVFK